MNKWRLLFALFAVFHPIASFTSGHVDGRRQCSDRRGETRLFYGSHRDREPTRLEVRSLDETRRDGVRHAAGFRKVADYSSQDQERELTRQIVAFRRGASVQRISRERDTDSVLREAYTDVRIQPQSVRSNLERNRSSNDRQRQYQVRSAERPEAHRVQSRQGRSARDGTSRDSRRLQTGRYQENANRREARRVLTRDNVARRSAPNDRRSSDHMRRVESERRFQDVRTKNAARNVSPLNIRVEDHQERVSSDRAYRYQSAYLARVRDLESRNEGSMARASRFSRQRDAVIRERDNTAEVRSQEYRNRVQVRGAVREESNGRSIRNLGARADSRQSIERRTRDTRDHQSTGAERRMDTRMLSRQDFRNLQNREAERGNIARNRDSLMRIRDGRVAERFSQTERRDLEMKRDSRSISLDRKAMDRERRDSRMTDATRKLPMERATAFYRTGQLLADKTEGGLPQSCNWTLLLYAAQAVYLCYMLLKLAGEKKINKIRWTNMWMTTAPKLVKVD